MNRREDNALVADARLSLASPAAAYVEYGNEADGWLRTPTAPPSDSHDLVLVRLRAGTAYLARAFEIDERGCATVYAEAAFQTDPLPAQLQRLSVQSSGQPTFPLAAVDLRLVDSDFRWQVVLDEASQVVWYHRLTRQQLGDDPGRQSAGFQLFSNGNLAFVVKRFAQELTGDARLGRRLQSSGTRLIHHDIVEYGDGAFMYLAEERRVVDDTRNGGAPDQKIRGDTLRVFDPATGVDEQVWSAFDFLDPTDRPLHWQSDVVEEEERDVVDWTHGNTISFGPSGNILVSFRHLDQIVSIAPDFRSVEWKLGGPGSSFSFPDLSDQFYGQHTPVQLPNGHVLLFDNGNYRPEGDYSRALELELDFATMTARKVWEYRHQPDAYADRIGNAVRLPNGNTLVSFGFRADDPTKPPFIVEARPDGAATWVQSLSYRGERPSFYRAFPLHTLAGEVTVEPTVVAHR